MQGTASGGAIADNLAAIVSAAEKAAAGAADVLVTPELFVSGYAPALVAHLDGAPHREELANIARQHRIHIAAATVEHSQGGRFILATLIDADGKEITRYRKRALFSTESAEFRPGVEQPVVVDIEGVPTALSVCYDVEFPELVRAIAFAGAELLLVPTAVPLRNDINGVANPFDTRRVPELLIPARALESQIFIAYANHNGRGFAGSSVVVDPYGRAIAKLGDEGGIAIGCIDRTVLAQARLDTDYLERARSLAVSRNAGQ